MEYYAFMAPGLEAVTAEELIEFGAKPLEQKDGVVIFRFDGAPEMLLRLGTTEDVFALVWRENVSSDWKGCRRAASGIASSPLLESAIGIRHNLRRRKVKRITYRVVVQRTRGRHLYRRKDLQAAVAGALRRVHPRWKEVPEDAHIEIWVRQDGDEVIAGVRLSDRTMRHRRYKLAHIEASLRPTIARAMVRLAKPGPNDVFLDPMCGAGTILIERTAEGEYGMLLGGDIRPEALAAARRNIRLRRRPIDLCCWDGRELPLCTGSVTHLVSNLPFGKKIGSEASNRDLYRAFLREAARVLAPRSRAVFLTADVASLESALRRTDGFARERRFRVKVLGQNAVLDVFAFTG